MSEDARNRFERVRNATQALCGPGELRGRLETAQMILAPLLLDDFPIHLRNEVVDVRRELGKDAMTEEEQENVSSMILSLYTHAARLGGALQDVI